MTDKNHVNKEETNMEEIRKEIEKGNTLKVRASERVFALREQYSKKVDELKTFDIKSPKDIKNDIDKRSLEIKELEEKIKGYIPSDIISKYYNKDFNTLSQEEPNYDQPF